MTETDKFTPQQIKLRERLCKHGLTMHAGGFNYDPLWPYGKMPVVSVWCETEEPTDEELKTLVTIAENRIQHFNPQVTDGLSAEGANMITVRKVGGLWTFRKLTWNQGPLWYPNRLPLEELHKVF